MPKSKLNGDRIPYKELQDSDLIYVAPLLTGLGARTNLETLKAWVLGSGSNAPSINFEDVAAMLANTTINANNFAMVDDCTDITSVGTTWGLFYFMGGDRDDISNYRLVNTGRNKNAWTDCGVVDLSATGTNGLFPQIGGTGAGGAVQRNNTFDVSVAGEVNGIPIIVGATLRALVDNPGSDDHSDWRIYM